MKKFKSPYKFMCILLFPISILLSYIASFTPLFIEKIYSNYLYRFIGQSLSIIFGFLPFSIFEFMLLFLLFFIVWKIIGIILKIIKEKSHRKYLVIHFLTNIFIFISIAYFLFIVLWGLNYYRLPFSKIAKLDVKPASSMELEIVCEDLIDRTNKLRNMVHENKDGIMNLSTSYVDMFNRASKGYEIAIHIYPELSGKYGNPKGVVFSQALSFAGIGGIYSPFTGEANVNIAMPDSILPSTACHEMAHQRGFAREDEANYIAYLACNMHPDVDFQYSGTLLALIHSMNALFRYDPEKYIILHKSYSKGLLQDLSAIKTFWQQYEGPIERASSEINNAYLKSNRQNDGVQSYGRMVDLLIAEYRLKMSK
ncbi:DUF3810 domain-containing protein [Marinisporobacter balticus]|uniref:Uncharacterized protein DUF3810 n=1 Tax=Marinisporobacter balticus TaxID=2018667 RepID=A0A4R2L1D6_9FIRM|nr:DUF3810 domain-containing protein [Marinisporobacter balticus]TCO79402.1 uncharacterized protein DUF3810 [Marinisporobacter balticus]